MDATFEAKEGLDDYIIKSPRHLVRLSASVRLALGRAEGRRRADEGAAERRRLEAELRSRAEALAEDNRRKDEFLAILAHEQRNPMAPIRNALHIIEQPGLAPEEAAMARERMGRQIRNLTRLVDDLLDVSRIARGQVELRKEPLDLATVVARALEVAERFRPRLALLDLGMPEMEGYELARRLRGQPDREGLILVALTGWGQDEDRRRSQEIGVRHRLVKPVEPDALARLVATLAEGGTTSLPR